VSEHEASPSVPSTPFHWRVRTCGWLWRGLHWAWGTLIVDMVVGTVANFNTTTTDTPLAKLYIVHLRRPTPSRCGPVWASWLCSHYFPG
jgi:hypothetical protein